MAEYLEVTEARDLPGLRLALTVGVPGPWGEAAKGVFYVKRIPFVKVRQLPGEPNEELEAWTGHDNAPIAVYENERPRTTWTEILFLAERLSPEPALIPADPAERARMFGLSHELCGELGLAWCRRLSMIHGLLSKIPEGSPGRAMAERLGAKYGYEPKLAEAAPQRVAQVLTLLSEQLREQRERGSPYMIGERLSALDIHWAAFAAILDPLPDDVCPLPPFMRQQYTARDPVVREALHPGLLAQRDFTYQKHLELPLSF